MISRMFETFGAKAVCVVPAQVLALQGRGRSSGLVVDFAEACTTTVAVHEGYILRHVGGHLDVGGSTITTNLMRLLAAHGYSSVSATRRLDEKLNSPCAMKSALCRVALNPRDEILRSRGLLRDYEVQPNVFHTIPVAEMLRIPEVLFDPSLCRVDDDGIIGQITKSLYLCRDAAVRRQLFSSDVVLTGGGSRLPGLAARIDHELEQSGVGPEGVPCPKVVLATGAGTGGDGSSDTWWIGGGEGVFDAVEKFKVSMSVSKAEYEEHGAEIVHKKCAFYK